ncbi:hypothetical protein FPFC_070050 [Fructobacillus pseudoficulneus]|uniref:Uncharacterized protein n=2 Tax=Fructobacillus pseudoficulneus TaxID=220714 RepID=A0A3F3H6J4_9LACO|nr:hypothetical protein FPFC_070050 [Fructobacillus pseudoficulneus]
MDAYRQQAEQNGTYAAVSDWNSFSNAYSNNNITFIDIQQNISAGVTALSSYSALKERNNSLILNGNGYTLALGRNALRTGKSPNFASNGQGGSVLTVTNLNLQQWTTDNSSPTSGSQGQEGGNNGQPDAAIDAYAAENSYGGWIYNIDNVSLQGQSTSSYRLQPARLLDAEGSYVVLSGNINVSARYSMMRISKVDIVNGANINFHVVGTPNLNDTTDFVAPMFDFSTNATTYSQRANATGNDHLFRVGDGVSISGTSINYVSHNALVQGTYYGMYVGDNVTWTQDFYDDFINQKNYNSITHPDSNRQYIFVQNFTFKALNNVDTHGQATYGMGYGIDGNAVISTKDNTNAYIYFAPGLTFSIN